MPEIVADGSPFQAPQGAASDFYATKTPASLGSFVGATLGDSATAFLARAAERGAAPGASVFDQGMAGVAAGPTDVAEANSIGAVAPAPPAPDDLKVNTPPPAPDIPPEQYNQLYAPRDATGKIVPIGDQPMPDQLAQIIGRQKSDEMQRESALSRFAATHWGPTTFVAGAAASMLDPLNLAAAFIPGVGEGAIAASLGGGFAARAAARLAIGAEVGAVSQAPLSALKMGLGSEEASDYSIRDAMRDTLYGAAGVALLHAGLGTAGELLGRGAEAKAAPIVSADAPTKNAAMRSSVAEIADGRPVDVEPVLGNETPPPAGEAPDLFGTTVDINGDRATISGSAAAPEAPGAAEAAPAAIPAPETAEAAVAAPEAISAPPALIGDPVASMAPHRVATADGGSVDVAPVVVEARDLKTSADVGYDATLQPRDRDRAAAGQQVREMASALEPERLGISAEADRGAPIVGPDGMVESGNGRTMAIRQAYAENGAPAQRYRDWLTSQGVDVSKYDEPVLVRQRTTPLDPAERQAFAIAANRPATLALSAPERALADSRAVTPDMLGLIRNPDDLGAIANRDFVRAFVDKLPQTEQGMMATSTGDLSAEGLVRVKNAVLASAYGDAPILTRVAEATHDDVKSISNALSSAAPIWAQMRADIAAGHVRADVDATPQLLEAVQRTADLRAKGTRLADALAQQDAFDRISTPVENWMRLFYDPSGRRAAGQARIAEALKLYATEARKVTAERGLDLGLAPVTAGDLQRLAIGGAGDQRGLPLGRSAGDGADNAADRSALRRSGPGEPGDNLGSAGGLGLRPGESQPRPAELARRILPPDPARAAADQSELLREGWAPGVGRDELAAANDAVFGKRAEPAAGTPEAADAAELAGAEQRLAQIDPQDLDPEDRAELASTAEALAKADTMRDAYEAAASCLTGLI